MIATRIRGRTFVLKKHADRWLKNWVAAAEFPLSAEFTRFICVRHLMATPELAGNCVEKALAASVAAALVAKAVRLASSLKRVSVK